MHDVENNAIREPQPRPPMSMPASLAAKFWPKPPGKIAWE
jgi:hypothetical protein